jgi:hypothetical protein
MQLFQKIVYTAKMKEVDPTTPIKFDVVLPLTETGGVRVPGAAIEGIARINNLPPDEWAFVKHDSVMRDAGTDELVIDTVDCIPRPPSSLAELETRPAVMYTYRKLGERALGGYIVDYRRMQQFPRGDRGLENGTQSTEHDEYRENLGTRRAVGAVFAISDEVHYVGDINFIEQAGDFARQVDEHVKAMAEPKPLSSQIDSKQSPRQVSND